MRLDLPSLGKGGIYVVRWSGRINPRTGMGVKKTAYGPFASRVEAEQANLYTLPQETIPGAGRPWAMNVMAYDAAEIESMMTSPEEHGLKTFALKPGSALREHASWRNFGLSRHGYYMYLETGQSKWLK